MPELPEVESVRRSLEPRLVGQTVRGVRLQRPDVVGHDRSRSALLAGARIDRLLRHGKQLAIVAGDGRCVRVHLGMSGQMLFLSPRARPPRRDHVHAIWSLIDRHARPGGRLLFRDPRRFGGLATFRTLDDLQSHWDRLGPDALSLTARSLARVLASTRRALKDALLDQTRLAGLGNIYTDEALSRAALAPDRAARSLGEDEVARLCEAIREVLRESVRAGGSTLGDGGYLTGDGAPGAFQRRLRVYGRSGAPCVQCGGELLRSVRSQRTTVHCPACQT